MYSSEAVKFRLSTYAKRNRFRNNSVFIAFPIVASQIVWVVYLEPISLLLACIPLIYTVPIFLVLDRVEPEPRVAKIYAFLFGAFVATSVALIINGLVEVFFGGTASIVLSAPVTEESMKFLGIYWAFRKRLINGPLDGVVYAALIALGFASIENITYFYTAASDQILGVTFILRGIFSPFAHPLFTMWTGVFLGKAIQAHRRISNHVVMGLALSISLHSLWNANAVIASFASPLLLLTIPAFVFIFAFSILYIYRLRKQEELAFDLVAQRVAKSFGISREKALIYGIFSQSMTVRKLLNRRQKKIFDRQRIAFSRLVSLSSSPESIRQNEVDELISEINFSA
jgi:RsiW-degrading membrane proteinase PrsW (M82 family)